MQQEGNKGNRLINFEYLIIFVRKGGQVKKTWEVLAVVILVFFLVSCGPMPVRSIEGIVSRVEFIPPGGFLKSRTQTAIYFADGKMIVFLGTPKPDQVIIIGKYNKIYFYEPGNYTKIHRIEH